MLSSRDCSTQLGQPLCSSYLAKSLPTTHPFHPPPPHGVHPLKFKEYPSLPFLRSFPNLYCLSPSHTVLFLFLLTFFSQGRDQNNASHCFTQLAAIHLPTHQDAFNIQNHKINISILIFHEVITKFHNAESPPLTSCVTFSKINCLSELQYYLQSVNNSN